MLDSDEIMRRNTELILDELEILNLSLSFWGVLNNGEMLNGCEKCISFDRIQLPVLKLVDASIISR